MPPFRWIADFTGVGGDHMQWGRRVESAYGRAYVDQDRGSRISILLLDSSL